VVTLDPESVFFVGRLRPLVDEVLPEVRRRLGTSLPGLGMSRDRLRDAVLGARRQGQQVEQLAPAF
jgi:hypothetical protein